MCVCAGAHIYIGESRDRVCALMEIFRDSAWKWMGRRTSLFMEDIYMYEARFRNYTVGGTSSFYEHSRCERDVSCICVGGGRVDMHGIG